MAHKPFKVGTNNPFLTQPAATAKVYVRTTSTPGGAATIGVVGTANDDSALSDSFAGPVGLEEKISAEEFKTLTGIVITNYAFLVAPLYVYSLGTAATGEFRMETIPADGTTVTVGLTGLTKVYRFKNTLAAINDVKITTADLTATMLSFKKAINLDGVAGTDYFTGTAANAYVSATVSGTIITLTDRVGCNRQLDWVLSQSSTHFSLPSTLSGGTDGVLLVIVVVGQNLIYDAFTLSTEDISTATLPALLAPTTDAIKLSGRACTLQFKCPNIANAIALRYETSTDGVNWSYGQASITSLDNNPVGNKPLVVIPTERNIERIRLVFTSNTNTLDTALDARVIF